MARKPTPSSFRGIHLARETPNQRHEQERSHSARQIGDAGMSRGVAQQFLHQQWQQNRAAIEDESNDGHNECADGIRPVAEDAEIDDRMFGFQLADDAGRRDR